MLKKENEVAVIHPDSVGLWTVDLYINKLFARNIGGSYPKPYSCEVDAHQTWGTNLDVKISRLSSISEIEDWLNLNN